MRRRKFIGTSVAAGLAALLGACDTSRVTGPENAGPSYNTVSYNEHRILATKLEGVTGSADNKILPSGYQPRNLSVDSSGNVVGAITIPRTIGDETGIFLWNRAGDGEMYLLQVADALSTEVGNATVSGGGVVFNGRTFANGEHKNGIYQFNFPEIVNGSGTAFVRSDFAPTDGAPELYEGHLVQATPLGVAYLLRDGNTHELQSIDTTSWKLAAVTRNSFASFAHDAHDGNSLFYAVDNGNNTVGIGRFDRPSGDKTRIADLQEVRLEKGRLFASYGTLAFAEGQEDTEQSLDALRIYNPNSSIDRRILQDQFSVIPLGVYSDGKRGHAVVAYVDEPFGLWKRQVIDFDGNPIKSYGDDLLSPLGHPEMTGSKQGPPAASHLAAQADVVAIGGFRPDGKYRIRIDHIPQ